MFGDMLITLLENVLQNPSLECDNKISSIKNDYGYVDGHLSEKEALHDKTQHKFI